MRKIHSRTNQATVPVVPINAGGTGTLSANDAVKSLDIVPLDDIGVPSGVLGLDSDMKVVSSNVPSSYYDSVGRLDDGTVSGPVSARYDVENFYVITNYNENSTYDLRSDIGTATRVKDIISYTWPSIVLLMDKPPLIGFWLNNRFIKLNPVTDRINAPVLIPPNSRVYRKTNLEVISSPLSIFNGNTRHRSTDWEVYSDPDCKDIVLSKSTNSSELCVLRLSLSDIDAIDLYFRARHNGDNNEIYSEWSNVIHVPVFTVLIDKPVIIAPTLTPSAVFDTKNSTITCSPFVSNDAIVMKKDTVVEIYKDPGCSTLLLSHSTASTQFCINKYLTPNINAYIRLKYTSTMKGVESSWSDVYGFITNDIPSTTAPIVISPQDDANNVPISNLYMKVSPRTERDSIYHDKTEWQLSIREDFSDILYSKETTKQELLVTKLPLLLLALRVYYIRCRFHDSNLNAWGEWSDHNKFTTMNIEIVRPWILDPADYDIYNGVNTITVTSSNFAMKNYEDSHSYTEWQVYRNDGTLVNSGVNGTNNKTKATIRLPEIAGLYYVKVRYIASTTKAVSDWSNSVNFYVKDKQYSEVVKINDKVAPVSIASDIVIKIKGGKPNDTFTVSLYDKTDTMLMATETSKTILGNLDAKGDLVGSIIIPSYRINTGEVTVKIVFKNNNSTSMNKVKFDYSSKLLLARLSNNVRTVAKDVTVSIIEGKPSGSFTVKCLGPNGAEIVKDGTLDEKGESIDFHTVKFSDIKPIPFIVTVNTAYDDSTLHGIISTGTLPATNANLNIAINSSYSSSVVMDGTEFTIKIIGGIRDQINRTVLIPITEPDLNPSTIDLYAIYDLPGAVSYTGVKFDFKNSDNVNCVIFTYSVYTDSLGRQLPTKGYYAYKNVTIVPKGSLSSSATTGTNTGGSTSTNGTGGSSTTGTSTSNPSSGSGSTSGTGTSGSGTGATVTDNTTKPTTTTRSFTSTVSGNTVTTLAYYFDPVLGLVNIDQTSISKIPKLAGVKSTYQTIPPGYDDSFMVDMYLTPMVQELGIYTTSTIPDVSNLDIRQFFFIKNKSGDYITVPISTSKPSITLYINEAEIDSLEFLDYDRDFIQVGELSSDGVTPSIDPKNGSLVGIVDQTTFNNIFLKTTAPLTSTPLDITKWANDFFSILKATGTITFDLWRGYQDWATSKWIGGKLTLADGNIIDNISKNGAYQGRKLVYNCVRATVDELNAGYPWAKITLNDGNCIYRAFVRQVTGTDVQTSNNTGVIYNTSNVTLYLSGDEKSVELLVTPNATSLMVKLPSTTSSYLSASEIGATMDIKKGGSFVVDYAKVGTSMVTISTLFKVKVVSSTVLSNFNYRGLDWMQTFYYTPINTSTNNPTTDPLAIPTVPTASPYMLVEFSNGSSVVYNMKNSSSDIGDYETTDIIPYGSNIKPVKAQFIRPNTSGAMRYYVDPALSAAFKFKGTGKTEYSYILMKNIDVSVIDPSTTNYIICDCFTTTLSSPSTFRIEIYAIFSNELLRGAVWYKPVKFSIALGPVGLPTLDTSNNLPTNSYYYVKYPTGYVDPRTIPTPTSTQVASGGVVTTVPTTTIMTLPTPPSKSTGICYVEMGLKDGSIVIIPLPTKDTKTTRFSTSSDSIKTPIYINTTSISYMVIYFKETILSGLYILKTGPFYPNTYSDATLTKILNNGALNIESYTVQTESNLIGFLDFKTLSSSAYTTAIQFSIDITTSQQVFSGIGCTLVLSYSSTLPYTLDIKNNLASNSYYFSKYPDGYTMPVVSTTYISPNLLVTSDTVPTATNMSQVLADGDIEFYIEVTNSYGVVTVPMSYNKTSYVSINNSVSSLILKTKAGNFIDAKNVAFLVYGSDYTYNYVNGIGYPIFGNRTLYKYVKSNTFGTMSVPLDITDIISRVNTNSGSFTLSIIAQVSDTLVVARTTTFTSLYTSTIALPLYTPPVFDNNKKLDYVPSPDAYRTIPGGGLHEMDDFIYDVSEDDGKTYPKILVRLRCNPGSSFDIYTRGISSPVSEVLVKNLTIGATGVGTAVIIKANYASISSAAAIGRTTLPLYIVPSSITPKSDGSDIVTYSTLYTVSAIIK